MVGTDPYRMNRVVGDAITAALAEAREQWACELERLAYQAFQAGEGTAAGLADAVDLLRGNGVRVVFGGER
ncbi:hypothetical protein HFP15_16160 [Amycolatopsis sp. K13G38]|uniref:Uncharacterized protein n=1 Tax=Amycolatopsis acididurans TaxID=2724524 RepID=A0ABX1J4X6_9PSEU|nr:hypothetical protein [Amycolatopsis acididurans]NKQ54416.1 hypothetical protein [Amycolatopsis acididurans]